MLSLARWFVLCCAIAVAIGCTPRAPRGASPGDEAAAPAAGGAVDTTSSSAAKPPSPPASPADEETREKKTEPAADSTSVAGPLTPECEDLWKQIQELDGRIPMIYVGLRRSTADIHKDMVAVVDLCRRFLVACPGSAQMCSVKSTLARILLARHRRYLDELKQQGLAEGDAKLKHAQYLDEVLRLAEEVVRDCAPSSRARITGLRVLVDIYEQRGEFEKLRQAATKVLTEMPDYEWRPNLQLAVAQSYLSERKYVEAVKYIDGIIKAHPNDPEYVAYLEKLNDALTGAGDLERIEELWQLIRAEFPVRIPELPRESYLTGYYETSLCVADFWLGFVKMALGEWDEARKHFRAQIEAANDAQKGDKKKAGPVQSNVCVIFRDMRSSDMLYWLDEHGGKAPGPGFDLTTGVIWASDQKLAPRDLEGKVVAILARMPENRRAESFLQELDALVKSHGKEGLVVLSVGFLAGAANPTADAQLIEKLREELKRLNVSLPAGFEADRAAHKLFHSLHLTVGTASFVILNRRGEQAWYLADPRDMDRGILRRVVERLLSEKPGAEKKPAENEKK